MYQCLNCGYQMGDQESNCKYCGTSNPSYKKETKSNYSFNFTPPTSNSTTSKNNFSWLLFIILLIVFWPLAIVYLVISNTKKQQ